MDINPAFLEVAKTVGAITVGALSHMFANWWRRRIPLRQLKEMCVRRFDELDKKQGELALAVWETQRGIVNLQVSVAKIRGRLKLNGDS